MLRLLAAIFATLCAATASAQLTPAAIQSQYDATPRDGTIAVTSGQWPTGNWGPFAPKKTDPEKSVLWQFATATPPQGAIGDNDVTTSFWGGHVNFMRNVFTGNPGSTTVLITLDDYSRGYKTIDYNHALIGEFPTSPPCRSTPPPTATRSARSTASRSTSAARATTPLPARIRA